MPAEFSEKFPGAFAVFEQGRAKDCTSVHKFTCFIAATWSPILDWENQAPALR